MTAVDSLPPAALRPGPADDGPPRELLASWLARVVAVVLDHALIAALTFLVLPVQPVTPLTLPGLPSTTPGDDLGHVPVQSGGPIWWVVALVAAMVLAQAYLGSTPGKLVMGIAVVRLDDARPAGLLLTVARAALHVLDGLVLMIGFLRPLWHPRNATFADSIAGTVALRTSAPLPYRLRRNAPRPAPAWQRPGRPRWRRTAWWVAAALCGPALALTYGPSTVQGGATTVETCDSAGAPYDSESFVLLTGVVEAPEPAEGTVTRLGIQRRYAIDMDREVRVGWEWTGTAPQEPVELRLVLASADGSTTHAVTADLVDGMLLAESDGVSVRLEGDTVVLPASVLDPLGAGWTWTASARSAAGEVLGQCAGPSLAPAR